MQKIIELPVINKCRCGGTAKFRNAGYWISCQSCGAQSTEGSSFPPDWKCVHEYKKSIIDSWNLGKYRDWQDDYLYDCMVEPLSRSRKVKMINQKEYEKLISTKPIEDFYWDQSCRSVDIYDRNIFSAHLPLGIKRMDTWYSLRIREMGTPNSRFKYTTSQLRKGIMNNVHLHMVIKFNLLSNLNSYTGI